MSGLSGMSADTRNKAIAVGVFVAIAAGILYYEFGGGTPNPAAVAPAVATPTASAGQDAAGGANENAAARPTAAGNAARRVAGGSAALDPALHMDAMLASEQVEYSGAGRNIFSPYSAPPVVIPKSIAPARPLNLIPPSPVRTGLPPPPPIDLTFWDGDGRGRGAAGDPAA